MRLEDGEILLRPFAVDDAPALAVAIDDDPELDHWTRIPFPYTEEHALEFISTTEEKAFAIVDRANAALLGGIGARIHDEGVVELGYWVRASARGRGVATRAVRLLAGWAFDELAAGRLQLTTDPANHASQRVAEKAGFQREGILRGYTAFKGRRRDAVMYSLLPEDL
ncbi:MAG TPA: GNAT family protein [Gaiellaceae bacterium]|nr:GNAT family protein [Gaiellaceae bacterium]